MIEVTDEHHVVGPEPYRPWWPVWMMGAGALLLVSVAMTFTLVTSLLRADRAEELDDVQVAKQECRAAYNADVTAREQAADNAEHALLVGIIRLLFIPPDQRGDSESTLLTLADEIDRLNSRTTDRVEELSQFVRDGSPLPCPIPIDHSPMEED